VSLVCVVWVCVVCMCVVCVSGVCVCGVGVMCVCVVCVWYVSVVFVCVWCVCVCGPGSSVGIGPDYGLDGPGSNPGGDEIFCPSRPALGPTQPPVKWIPCLSRG